jgi:hypothetical protein
MTSPIPALSTWPRRVRGAASCWISWAWQTPACCWPRPTRTPRPWKLFCRGEAPDLCTTRDRSSSWARRSNARRQAPGLRRRSVCRHHGGPGTVPSWANRLDAARTMQHAASPVRPTTSGDLTAVAVAVRAAALQRLQCVPGDFCDMTRGADSKPMWPVRRTDGQGRRLCRSGQRAAQFIAHISGSYSGIMGLPIVRDWQLLAGNAAAKPL